MVDGFGLIHPSSKFRDFEEGFTRARVSLEHPPASSEACGRVDAARSWSNPLPSPALLIRPPYFIKSTTHPFEINHCLCLWFNDAIAFERDTPQ
jgi:hypothetical protein